jgi:ABC-2 type transport system permease protein
MRLNLQISPRRVGILLLKDIHQGSKNFLAVYALITPVILTLLVTLVFGDLFAQTPRLGLVDPGNSQYGILLQEMSHIQTTVYASEETLRQAVSRGVEELGLVLPPGLDESMISGGTIPLHAMRWGQASLQSLLTLESALNRAFMSVAGIPQTVQVETRNLASAQADTSWSELMMPLILIMAVTVGGLFISASTLIEEKQQRTLNALTTTVASLWDVYAAKLALGVIVGIVIGLVTLGLNRTLGNQPALLILVIALGALAASVLGILLGSVSKDMETFMALVKLFGFLLYAPGILALVPQAPEWIARLFPTYYIMNPILEITQKGAGLSGILTDLGILAAIVGTLLVILALLVERQQREIALAG